METASPWDGVGWYHCLPPGKMEMIRHLELYCCLEAEGLVIGVVQPFGISVSVDWDARQNCYKIVSSAVHDGKERHASWTRFDEQLLIARTRRWLRAVNSSGKLPELTAADLDRMLDV